jgi:hypothetical protein
MNVKYFCLLILFLVGFSEAGFLKARYRHNMKVGKDGEDERVHFRHTYKRQKDIKLDPNPPMFPTTKKSRSYHYNYGPVYPSHHNHLKHQYFPLPKNQLLHP